MSRAEIIAEKLLKLPVILQEEALDFIEYLELKSREAPPNGVLMTWNHLPNDWSFAEEDEAWKDL